MIIGGIASTSTLKLFYFDGGKNKPEFDVANAVSINKTLSGLPSVAVDKCNKNAFCYTAACFLQTQNDEGLLNVILTNTTLLHN